MEAIVSPEILITATGIILSLLFSYIPGLRVWYGGKAEEFKKLFMLSLMVAVAGVMFGLGCWGIWNLNLPCDKNGLFTLVWYLGIAISTNQAAYLLSPVPNDVKIAKFERDTQLPVG